MNTTRRIPLHRNRRRGSILLTVMIFSLLILGALGTYLGLGLNAMRTANRALNNYTAFNLAEAGIEEGMLALNAQVWSEWEIHHTRATRLISGVTSTQKMRYDIQIVIFDRMSNSPRIVSQGRAFVRNEPEILKQIEVRLERRSRFANCLVGRDRVTMNGNNAMVDSWDSDPDDNPATPAVPYSAAAGIRRDNGSVGSISVEMDALSVGNADIWGRAATGAAMPSVGPNGKVRGFGAVANPSPSNPEVDLDRVATDFSANLDHVTAPTSYEIYTATGGSISGTTPITGPKTYLVNSISLSSKSVVTISGNVTLIVTNNIGISGQAEIHLNAGASLTVYVNGNVNMAGQGVFNSNAAPESVQIYGTNPTSQSISYSGQAAFVGVIYAPEGDISMTGQADNYGAFVGRTIVLSGRGQVHYDEALADLGGAQLGVNIWRELVDDRLNIAHYFSD